jgi:DNA-binding MarR family transcriptional regulator
MAAPKPIPHSHAIRSLVQSLAGDAGMTGLELFRSLHMVTNAFAAAADERLREAGLSGPRWVLLLRLLAEERCGGGQGLSPTDLSQRQNVSKNTISVLLRGLEDQGLIERRLVPDDRRAFQIHLTDAGRALVENTAPGHIAFLNDMCAGLTPEESLRLIESLQKLHRSLSSGDRRQGTGDRGQETGDRGQVPTPGAWCLVPGP